MFNLRLKDRQIKDAALGIEIIRFVCSALIDGLKQPMVVKKYMITVQITLMMGIGQNAIKDMKLTEVEMY